MELWRMKPSRYLTSSLKEGSPGNPAFSKSASKVATLSVSTQLKPLLFLDQLDVDVTGTIVVMIGRVWDVNAVTGRYLSTNFVVSDSKAVSIPSKNFVVLPNKDEFRIFRHDRFMIEFDGETSTRKVSADPHGFRRGQSLRVTLWGELGDVLVEKKTKHAGVCAMVLTGMSGKEYNNKLYLSSTSSTVFYDDDDIPCLQELRADDRKGASRKNGKWVCEACNRVVDYPVFRYRLEAVVADNTTHTVVVMFSDTATELLKCSAESLMGTEDEGSDADDDLNFPLAIRNLIGTTHVLEIKSHTYYEYGTFESFNCWKINPSETAKDDASSSTPAVTANDAELSMKIVMKPPTICTPLKPNEERKQKGHELEDSDVDEVCGPLAKKGKSSADVAVDTKKKRKRSATSSHNNQRITPSFRGLLQNPVTVHANTIVRPDGRVQSTVNTVLHNNQNITPSLPDLLQNPVSTHVNTIIAQDGRIQSTMNIGPTHLRKAKKEPRKRHSPLQTPGEVDDIISTEMPSPTADPDGYKVVTHYMLHRSCGKEARNATCTSDRKCSKHFPKPFLVETFLDDDGYPHYRRRDNKLSFHLPNQNAITLRDSERLPALLQREGIDVTMFTDWFELNKRDPDARTLTYADIPKHYVWHEQSKLSDDSQQKEATYRAIAPQQRDIFITMLIFCDVSRPLKLWEESWQTLSKDILAKKRKLFKYPNLQLTDEQIKNYCLIEIKELLHKYGRSLADFKDLPQPDLKLLTNIDNHLIREALDFDIKKSRAEHQHLHSLLNPEQRIIYEDVVQSVHNKKGNFYFVYGPRGIVSLLLPTGKTAHSRFVIPLELIENNTCGIKQNTQLAELMQEVQLIIWDEAPMTQRYAFEALDTMLRDILGFTDSEKRRQIFGGMTVLLGGDFRQILPVIPQAKRPEIVQACINMSELWRYCKVFTLTCSMRVNEYSADGAADIAKQEFNRWVLAVGDGTLPAKMKEGEDEPTWIDIPENFLIKTAILTPQNDDADAINEFMFKQLSGKSMTCNSAYENLNPSQGLCNGTRLIITDVGQFVIHAKILTGSHIGDEVVIHRIILTSPQSKWPFVLKRRQLPVKPCYAMTINKSQDFRMLSTTKKEIKLSILCAAATQP
ncbi:ATP-dependent DNA helicase PIF1-like protein [Tanacetum coccineum]